MTSKPRRHRGFAVFKALVYGLLALDVALYAWQGTATEAIDTAAWVTLLLLFERETGGWRLDRRGTVAIHALRATASVAIVWACIAYAIEREWLDFANALTWLGVVLALELEVRVPQARTRFHYARRIVAWLLYGALALFASIWIVQALRGVDGAALDAWDALLWLAAFVVIELNVFRLSTVRPVHAESFGR